MMTIGTNARRLGRRRAESALLGEGFAYRATDLRPVRRRPGTADLDQQRAVQVDAAGDHRGTGRFFHRSALTGDDGFVGVGDAVPNHAVDRETLAGPHPDQRSGGQVPGRPAFLCPVLDHRRPLAFGFQERCQAAHRPRPADRLQVAANSEQHQQHGRGVEIDLCAAGEHAERGTAIGGQDADGDQRARRQPAASPRPRRRA
jgi:hypothetical protein